MERPRSSPAIHAALALAAGLAVNVLSPDRAGATGGSTTTHKEAAPITFRDLTKRLSLATFCLNEKGNLLVCIARPSQVRTISPSGKRLAAWNVPFTPQAICTAPKGITYVGGLNKVARLGPAGKVLKTIDLPTGGSRYQRVTALAADGKDLFVGFRGRSGYTVYRCDGDFGSGKQILKGQRGCCGQFHFIARNGMLYVADNCRHRVARYDRNGRFLSAWGQRSRTGIEGFGSCCNPMNLCFGPNGEIYTAEASLLRIKSYSPEGKLLGLVGTFGGRGGCRHVAVAASDSGSKVYMIDVYRNSIRVLAGPPTKLQPPASAARTARR